MVLSAPFQTTLVFFHTFLHFSKIQRARLQKIMSSCHEGVFSLNGFEKPATNWAKFCHFMRGM